ncbi:Putative uncharacterized protein [Taphrina deformans PYCC 5710]|uniref:Protein-serine/threonine kinase n=1 Tax=Taphrina deformans (strain PYCC 5710 / ATCC 11124 / CBS 356.35 / IMI 108563 / JCM 9778 / NBRC 8474) TaxID=1097556 RepID=R4XDN3_TAPDE|nr:Putative uncharacterized protein [Taphrina deformans PYCC 5710]|eukprot:CCG82513.1 Putative uncharacterized protein [Taphrina deformans PYCC 5710]
MSSAALLRHFAARELHCINLGTLLDRTNHATSKTILDSALWHATEELPTRLAHRIDDLDSLPKQLRTGNVSVDTVRKWYEKSFNDLLNFSERHKHKKSDQLQTADWEDLGRCLKTIDKRHQPVATTLAEGFHRHLSGNPELSHDDTLQSFLEVFHLSRIGMRTTSSQHMTLLQNLANGGERPGLAGIIEKKMSVRDVLEKASADAKQVCVDYYGIYQAPTVKIEVPESLVTTYIPGYLWHISFELLKNSLRAIVETYEEDKYRPVTVTVSTDSTDDEFVIKLSDLGGGIPAEGESEVWRYMYTTAESPYSPDEADDYMVSASERAIMAGFGYGLPISRLYSRFCGGDLRLQNKQGEGVDCYVHIPNKVYD